MRQFIYPAGFGVLIVIGLAIVFFSVTLGTDSANAYLAARGGMNTDQFLIILQAYTTSYQVIGALLAAIGGLGFWKCIKVTE